MSEVVKVQVVADTTTAKQQLQDLQTQLQHISTQPININNSSLVEANKMALELQQNLQKAMNPNTGKLDLRVFSQTLKASKRDLNDYAAALQRIGPEGQQAFLSLSRTIAMAEAPTSRLNASLIKFGNTIKNTINWQISSSLVHGIVGQFQSAINYAEKLNTSLNNIRIVTGASTDKMADFAKEANTAAKRLSTTTTAYTNASLIYYQQGLGDKEVAARTETTLKLANVSRQSVEEVSNQLTAIWNNYAEGASNLEHYADVITALGAATASSSSEIATGLEKFASIGKTVGLSYDYATTALATITAITRQSADTVGTGLRTLFSRLQGLKLGETLEDGVNLNKYSAALQTVGVNIQDQYGKVKDMDQILDELGAKWNTISKEQQIALAQTVGGVRQYTNLIALMDNWGTFQKNLKVAQGADGTLDNQAKIYGESWEAASKRVRASIETIYDELLNDKAIIKLIDGFAGFLDIIHGVVEGLGGMKGILLGVSSIFMSQYAKNIPGVLRGVWGGFKQFMGIGMTRTPYGRVDTKTYKLQQENEALLTRQANDMNASAADRMSARGSLTLAHMNQAYQARRKFMTPEQQAAEELKIKNTEATFNSLQQQAKERESYNTDADDQLRKRAREASTIERSRREQDELNEARNIARIQAENDRLDAEELQKTANRSKAQAQGAETRAQDWEAALRTAEAGGGTTLVESLRESAIQARRQANSAAQKAAGRQAAADEAKSIADESAERAEEARIAARTPEEIKAERERAAQQLFEKTHPGETYITEEMTQGRNSPYSRAQRQAQQDSLADNLRELNSQEGLLTDTALTAERSLGRFDSDLASVDTQRKMAWLKSSEMKSFIHESSPSQETLDAMWEARKKDSKFNDSMSEDQERKAAQPSKEKAKKYRENLEASIDATYGKDSAAGQFLKERIKAAAEDKEHGIEAASTVEEVQAAAEAIAAAVKQAIEEGEVVGEDENGQKKYGRLASAAERQKEIENAEDEYHEATGVSVEDAANFGIDIQRGQQGQFQGAMAEQDLNNPPEEGGEKTPLQEDPFGAITTGLGNVMATAASCAAELSAVSNAFNVIMDDSSSFAEVIGAVGGALGSMKNVGDVAQDAVEGIASSLGKAAPGWIGAAVSIGTAAFGLIKGYQEKIEKEQQEIRDKTKKAADEENEELEQSLERKIALEKSIVEQQKLIEKGTTSGSAYFTGQQAILENLQPYLESGKLSNQATALALSGSSYDLEKLQELIDNDRVEELQKGLKQNEAAANAAWTDYIKAREDAQDDYMSSYYGYYGKDNTVKYGYAINDGGRAGDETFVYDALQRNANDYSRVNVHKDTSGHSRVMVDGLFSNDRVEAVAAYHDLQAAYEDLTTTLSESEKAESEVYKNMGKLLDDLGPAMEEYEKFQDKITDYGIESTALGKNIEIHNEEGKMILAKATDIKTLEQFNEYRNAMIAKMTDGLEKDSQEYLDVVNSIDAYLGSLPNIYASSVGNLSTINKGLDGLVEQAKDNAKATGQNWDDDIEAQFKDQLIKLYEKYGNAVFSLNIPLSLDPNSDIESQLAEQLELLQLRADANHIQVQMELAKNFDLDGSSTIEQWDAFTKDIEKVIEGSNGEKRNLWEELFGDEFMSTDKQGNKHFDLAKFTALDPSTQQEMMRQYYDYLNNSYYSSGGILDQTIAKYNERIEEAQDNQLAAASELRQYQNGTGRYGGTSYTERSGVKSTAVAEHYEELAQLMNYYDLEHGTNGVEGRQLSESEIEDRDRILENLNSSGDWSNLTMENFAPDNFVRDAVEGYQALIEAERAAGEETAKLQSEQADLMHQREVYDQIGFRSILSAEAAAWGIDYQEVQEYAAHLREVNSLMEDNIQESEELALAQLKLTKGVEDLKTNWAQWSNILKNTAKAGPAYSAAIRGLKKDMSAILGMNMSKISDGMVEMAESTGVLNAAATGTDEGVEALQEFAFMYTTLDRALGTDENGYHLIENIAPEDMQAQFEAQLSGMFEGALDSYRTFAKEWAETEVGMPIPDTTGFIDAWVQARLAAGDSMDQIEADAANFGVSLTPTYQPVPADAEVNTNATYYKAVTDEWGAVVGYEQAGGEELETLKEQGGLFKITYQGSKLGSGSPPSGGGGGGGGGKKKKDHKKPDTGTRYHKIRAKQANNDQNKQETNRKKERNFGAEKIKQAEKEIELQKEAIELQRQYVDEINDYLAKDRTKMIEAFTPDKLGFDLGFNLEIDENGVITNYRQLEEKLLEEENKLIDKYNEGGLDDEAYEEAQKKIDEAREYLDIYEETRDLYEEEWIKLREYLDELADSALELTKLKIDLDISISDDTLALLDYMLEKIEDNAYKAAEAISLLGDKTNETLKRVDIYQSGLEEILNSKGLSLDDLANITNEQLINGDFTQAQIDQIREWRDALLDANKELLQMREDIINKIIDAFNELNDKVQESYDQFDNYNSIIEDYTNITDLLGIRLNQQQKELIKMLGQAALNNAQTQAAAARTIYEEALANQQAAQKAYEQAVANGDTEAMRQWEKVVKETQTVLDDAQQQWLEAWQAALEKAQELYTKAIEDTVKAFEESVSGAFGTLDYLQSAFDRMGQTNDQYLQDFEKLYELNKLNRDIQNAIDDTTNIRDKQALRDLQKEINHLQEEGIELSQYDVDALRKKFELEQARLALEDARNAKSEVRLQRDANGNWGYVYTAKEDEVAKAEQEYEDKLYEYQKLNDEYITELQSRVLETQTTYKETLAEIYNDTTLTDAQREARINELNNWLQAELSYFEQQLNNAMDNQQGTLDLYYNKYNNAQAKLADSWDETTLRMLTGANSVAEYMDNVKKSVEDMLQSSSEALSQYNKDVDETNHMAGVETEDYGKEVSDAITTIGKDSAKTREEVAKLSEELKDNFVDSLKEAINWEEEYANKINAAVEANENFIKSINEMIAKLAELESSNPGLEKARTAYQAAELAHEEYVQEWKKQHPDEDVVEADIVDQAWEKAKAEWQKYLEEVVGISPIYDTGVPQSLKTGGYTGRWNIASAKTGMYTGSWAGADVEENGRLAFLHQKELVLNADDTQNFLDATQILRTIDLSTNMFSKGLGNIITPWIGDMRQQDLEQNVHIEASFPNVTEHNEIERAFDNLINRAAQYVNRK